MKPDKELGYCEEHNGNYIGICKKKNIIKRESKQGLVSFHLKDSRENEWHCEARKDNFSLLSIADECAPLFGFSKIGTVVMKLGKTNYTCSERRKEDLKQIVPTCNINTISRRKLQDFFVFRWIMGVPITNKEIFLYEKHYCTFLTRVRNDDIIVEKWFVDTVKDSKMRLLGKKRVGDYMEKIKEIIKRINAESIIYYHEIWSRLSPQSSEK